jgi:hypothetical protein
MFFQRLEGSVGNGGRNNPIDVAVIQTLMKRVYSRVVPMVRRSIQILIPPDRVSGLCTPELIGWIEGFQREMLNIKKPDGRIDPDGRTFIALMLHVARLPGPLQHPPLGSTVKSLLFGPKPGNAGLLTRVDPKMFRTLYIKQNGLGLTLTKGEELLVFFGFLQKDPEITDIRWAAYMNCISTPIGLMNWRSPILRQHTVCVKELTPKVIRSAATSTVITVTIDQLAG